MKFEEGQVLIVTSNHSTGTSALSVHGFDIRTEVKVLELFEEDERYPVHYLVENINDEDETYFVAEDDLEAIEDDK